MGRCCWASESEREKGEKKEIFLGFCALVMEKRDGDGGEGGRKGEREREKRERLKRVWFAEGFSVSEF
jgi:hypothetical protein